MYQVYSALDWLALALALALALHVYAYARKIAYACVQRPVAPYLEERVGHATTDDDAVRLLDQVVDQGDLV